MSETDETTEPELETEVELETKGEGEGDVADLEADADEAAPTAHRVALQDRLEQEGVIAAAYLE